MVYKMEVFSPSLELQGILETFSSLLVTEQAFKAGEFTLDFPMTDATKTLLVPDNIIWFYDSVAGIIESISASTSEAGISVTLRGPLLSGLLSRRILWGLYNVSGSPSKIMCDMVADCAVSPTRGDAAARVIPGLTVGERPTDTRSIRKQSTGDNLLDFLTDVGQTNLTAFGVDFDPATPGMVFWARPGVNRTIDQTDVDPVYYGTELDDVLSSAYDYDSSGYGNMVLVAGEGEGNNRIMIVVESGNADTPIPPPEILPDGYTELEYIESVGGQYIDTGFFASDTSQINMTFQLMQNITDGAVIFGAEDSTGQISLRTTNLSTLRAVTGTRYVDFDIESASNIIFNVKKGGSFCEINSETKAIAATTYTCTNSLHFFGTNMGAQSGYNGKMRVYAAEILDNDSAISSFVPCINSDEEIGLYDTIQNKFFKNSGSGDFVAGPQVLNKLLRTTNATGFKRFETYVDARDLQKDADAENPMTDEEYQMVLHDRGLEKLSDAQLIQSFEATIRTQNPTYEYGKDFFLGDTITVKDDRLGVSVSAVVESAERSVSSNGEDLIFTFGYGAPTITEKIKRGLK